MTETTLRDGTKLRAGMTLVGTYKGALHLCHVVRRDGELRFVTMPDRTAHDSLSAAARHATDQTAVNGRLFWRPLKDLVREYVEVVEATPELAARR